MAGWIALGKPTARIVDKTRVDTLSVETGLSVTAVVIALAANRLTSNQRVADKARRALTHRPVVLDKALRIGATVARIHTLAVDAGLTVGAVIVASTARRVGQFNRDTTGI